MEYLRTYVAYVRVSEGLGRRLVVIKWHGGGLEVLTAGLKEVITASTERRSHLC